MLPCKRILCPIDFSDASFEALKVASELAENFSAELLVLHVSQLFVVPPDIMEPTGFPMQTYNESMTEQTGRMLENAAASRVPAGVRQRTILIEGDASHEIIEAARREKTQLIVIATHGMTGLRHYIFGSVAQRVIQHAPCSVLVVRWPFDQSGG